MIRDVLDLLGENVHPTMASILAAHGLHQKSEEDRREVVIGREIKNLAGELPATNDVALENIERIITLADELIRLHQR